MDTYHAGCIACHNEQLSAGKTSGPVVCAGCHDKATKDGFKPAGLRYGQARFIFATSRPRIKGVKHVTMSMMQPKRSLYT